jgi:hypothetical protein
MWTNSRPDVYLSENVNDQLADAVIHDSQGYGGTVSGRTFSGVR